jgi:fermentation-respiration switch protein FrsA (DUF1100 family)
MIKDLGLIFLFLIFIAVYIRYIELRSIFYPYRAIENNPKSIGLDYEDCYFKTEDGILLNGWLIKKSSAKSTILFFHGNAGNIGHRLEKLALFYNSGVNTFIIDYRGYGKSQGRPSEEGIYKDARAAYDYLLSRGDSPGKKIAYGESLGSTVAIDLCRHRQIDGLIVDSAFTNAKDMGRVIFPFIPSFLIANKFDSLNKILGLAIPKLFIHSINDEIVPFSLGEKLFKAATAPKEFLKITGGHNSGFWESQDLIREKITEFLHQYQFL